jgi:hypothetical protein
MITDRRTPCGHSIVMMPLASRPHARRPRELSALADLGRVASIIPQAPVLAYVTEACRIAKADSAAEYEPRHARRRRW